MNIKTKKVPARALKCSVGEFVFKDNGDGAKSAPVTLVARSGGVIEHWYFGPIVHDLQGMTHKDRIPIDYCHDAKDIIGYVNKFSTDENSLLLAGALVPFKDSDRASEIIHKQKAGVPYQASIDYTPTKPDEILFEEIGENQLAEVNGQHLQGPLTIVRKWNLGGVAVCPYGADSDTAAYVQNQGDQEKEINIMGTENAQEVEAAPEAATEQEAQTQAVETPSAEQQQAVEESPDQAGADSEAKEEEAGGKEENPAQQEAAKTEDNAQAEPPPAVPPVTLDRSDYLFYVQQYGREMAVQLFEAGTPREQAHEKYVQALKEENARLKEQVGKQSAPGFDPARQPEKLPSTLSREEIEAVAKRYGVSVESLIKSLKK